jgi:hypothetical protein
LVGLALLAVAACSDDTLGPAQNVNIIDTVTVGALDGTPLDVPSGFSITSGRVVRTDTAGTFDFVFNVDKSGRPVFLTRSVLGLPSNGSLAPGFLRMNRPFDAILLAESDGYVSTDTIPLAVGDVFIGRSAIACVLGVPLYAKFEILGFGANTVTFRVLANINCGFRSLEPGVPKK